MGEQRKETVRPVTPRCPGPYSTRHAAVWCTRCRLAEAMVDQAMDVRIVGLAIQRGLFRPVRAPYILVPNSPPADTLEERVFASIDDLEAGSPRSAATLTSSTHQDCISARAAARVRDGGRRVRVVRTVHHVDDFTTAALIECQRKAIEEHR